MSADVINESVFWLSCFLTGIGITMVYDVLLIMRRVINHNNFFVAIEDVVFWMFVSVVLFLLLYHMNNGTVRWFAVFGLLVGMLFYKKIIGDSLVIFMSTLIRRILHIVVVVCNPPLMLVKHAILKCSGAMRSLLGGVKKRLTGNIKKSKIILCKRKKCEKRNQDESAHVS